MKITYIRKKFFGSSLTTIDNANRILQTYADDGYILTLRQLYYQFVTEGLIANKTSEYKRLGSIINDARLAGLIDWTAIEDRTRNLHKLGTWDSPADIVLAAAQSFKIDMWERQPTYIEVWIEKEALAGVFQRICDQLRVPFFSCRGYTSQSEMFGAGNRLKQMAAEGKELAILHFGDHDPSGIDMTRDIEERLSLFARKLVNVERLALNMNQIEQYAPPPNPAKDTDTRYQTYHENFGDESWELDALKPQVLSDLVSVNVNKYMDFEQWEKDSFTESKGRKLLMEMAKNIEKYEDNEED